MSVLPRILRNGNVLLPRFPHGTDAAGNEWYGDGLVEIKPTDPNYAAARAGARAVRQVRRA